MGHYQRSLVFLVHFTGVFQRSDNSASSGHHAAGCRISPASDIGAATGYSTRVAWGNWSVERAAPSPVLLLFAKS